MKLRGGMMLALSAGLLVLGGCAAAAPSGPVTSPTGKVYEPGVRPTETESSQTATLFLAQQQYQRALEEAQAGIAADSANPVHYFLAGQAYAGLGEFEQANESFQRAESIYPAYELEIEPAREAVWAEAFNAGVEAYNAGNLAEAAQQWASANLIYDLRPESFQNLAVVYTQQNEYQRAIEAYRGALAAVERTPATRELTPEEITERAETRKTALTNLAELLTYTEQYAEAETLYRQQLESDPDNVELRSNLALAIAKQGREAEAQEIYAELLARPDLSSGDLFNVGVALFNAKNYTQAAEAFRRVTEALPQSRDAWYNYANALYAQNEYAALVPVAERLVQVDPLSENSALILARAYREAKQNQKALAALQANEAAPIHLEDLQMQPRAGRTRVSGRAIGNAAAAGTPVQLRFTFYGPAGEVGTETVTVSAPAEDASTDFEVVLETEQPVQAYRYELVR
jgi:tetratricopeptide (TPR) repeat protein